MKDTNKMILDYPEWHYYPSSEKPPEWAHDFVAVVAAAKSSLSSVTVSDLTSDIVLSHLAPGLTLLNYKVETNKTAAAKIRRPVLLVPVTVP